MNLEFTEKTLYIKATRIKEEENMKKKAVEMQKFAVNEKLKLKIKLMKDNKRFAKRISDQDAVRSPMNFRIALFPGEGAFDC